MIAIAGLTLCSGILQHVSSVPEGARGALYEYVIRAYGVEGLSPMTNGTPDPGVLRGFVGKKLTKTATQGYVRLGGLKILRRNSHGMTLALRVGLDRAKPEMGTAYFGRVQVSETRGAWRVASAHLDRVDDLGLDAESEIAAYRLAISKCSVTKVFELPRNTPDRVFLPLKRSFTGVTRQFPKETFHWDLSILPDKLGGKIKSGVLDLIILTGYDINQPTRVPYLLVGQHGHVRCQALSTAALPVSVEADVLADAAGKEARPVFVDSPQSVIDVLKKRGVRAFPDKTFKKDEDHLATGFIRIERPFVRWFSRDHAFASFTTYFRPKGGDVTYSSGGPYELRWVDGKVRVKRLSELWAGE